MNAPTSTTQITNTANRLAPETRHLLSRALMFFPPDIAERYADLSRKQVVDQLLRYMPALQHRPIKDYDSIQAIQPDRGIALGNTWIYDQSHDPVINEKRKHSLAHWIIGTLYEHGASSVMSRMFLFWGKVFKVKVSLLPFAPKAFRHFDILRIHALGNLPDLLTDMVADPGMMYYYRKQFPGERKFFEQVTMQLLGPLSGHMPGELKTSREKIRKLSRIINKWHFICDNADLHYPNLSSMEIYKEENRHFYEAYFNRSEAQGVLSELRQMIAVHLDFQTALNLSGQLIDTFLGKGQNPEIQQRLQHSIADGFMESKFDITTWLRKLFMNDLFYRAELRSNKPKSAMDFLFRLAGQLRLIQVGKNELERYAHWDWFRSTLAELGEDLLPQWGGSFEHPELAEDGKITPQTIDARGRLVTRLFDSGYVYKNNKRVVNLVELVSAYRNPSDAASVVDESVERFFHATVPSAQKKIWMETYLLGGQRNPSLWPPIWYAGGAQGQAEDRSILQNKLRAFFTAMLTHPDYHYF